MRTHRFKAWSTELNKFSDIFTLQDGIPQEFKHGIIVESTGMFDNHNDEIFESDIVETYCFNKTQSHTVVYTINGFTAGGYHLNEIFFVGGGDSFKIVGNALATPSGMITANASNISVA